MRIKYEIGNGPVIVDCLVILADEEVKEVMYKGTNIVGTALIAIFSTRLPKPPQNNSAKK